MAKAKEHELYKAVGELDMELDKLRPLATVPATPDEVRQDIGAGQPVVVSKPKLGYLKLNGAVYHKGDVVQLEPDSVNARLYSTFTTGKRYEANQVYTPRKKLRDSMVEPQPQHIRRQKEERRKLTEQLAEAMAKAEGVRGQLRDIDANVLQAEDKLLAEMQAEGLA